MLTLLLAHETPTRCALDDFWQMAARVIGLEAPKSDLLLPCDAPLRAHRAVMGLDAAPAPFAERPQPLANVPASPSDLAGIQPFGANPTPMSRVEEQSMFDINGKTAVVTGGTSGIGLATAKAFLEKGAKVVIAGRNPERGAAAEAELKKTSPDVVFRQTDTSNEEDVKALVDFAVERFGSLDIMFNNAGIGIFGTADQMSGEDYRKVIDINLTGVFYGVKYAALQMEKQGAGGAIVSTSSIEGKVGDPNLVAYNSAKGGVNLMTKSAAIALAKHNIRVNTVNPGYIETGMVNEDTMGKDVIDHLVGLHPLARLGRPEEIAHGVVFLVENEFTTGINLYIDGGYTAQ
jgi:NAD(P)-dependent dehydrogenase (short-subunit alcohol dehydrogenase family)